MYRYSLLCGILFDTVDAVKLESPKGFEIWNLKR